MSPLRRLATGVGALALVATAQIGLTAPAAQAAINPANCTFGFDGTWYLATCYDATPPSGWYLQTTCQRPNGSIYTNGGSMVYGSGTSRSKCGLGETLSLAVVSIY